MHLLMHSLCHPPLSCQSCAVGCRVHRAGNLWVSARLTAISCPSTFCRLLYARIYRHGKAACGKAYARLSHPDGSLQSRQRQDLEILRETSAHRCPNGSRTPHSRLPESHCRKYVRYRPAGAFARLPSLRSRSLIVFVMNRHRCHMH